MVFRVDAVQERLLRLEEVISELKELAKLDRPALRGTLRHMWAGWKRRLQRHPATLQISR